MVAMSLTLIQMLASLGSLVFFVAQWAGVIFLRRSSARVPWGLMVAGLLINTLTSIFLLLGPMIGISLFRSGRAFEWWWRAPQFGNVTFALGFALYGLQMARASQRQGELEQLVAAMSEEVDRLAKGSCRLSQRKAANMSCESFR
jgi:hypothetical protein